MGAKFVVNKMSIRKVAMADYAVLSAITMGLGGVGALYMGLKAGRVRAILPFGKRFTLKSYFRGVKEHNWPLWPPVLFGIGLLSSFYFFVQFARHLR